MLDYVDKLKKYGDKLDPKLEKPLFMINEYEMPMVQKIGMYAGIGAVTGIISGLTAEFMRFVPKSPYDDLTKETIARYNSRTPVNVARHIGMTTAMATVYGTTDYICDKHLFPDNKVMGGIVTGFTTGAFMGSFSGRFGKMFGFASFVAVANGLLSVENIWGSYYDKNDPEHYN